jgi:hypothetical protein
MIFNLVSLWYSRVIFKFMRGDTRKSFRDLEATSKKLTTKKLHLEFNLTCIRENLLPVYTQFNLHDATASKEPFVQDCRRSLIERQCTQIKEEVISLNKQFENHHSRLMSLLQSDLQRSSVNIFLNRLTDGLKIDLAQKHERKLFELYGGRIFTKQSRTPFINLTNEVVNDDLKEIFSLGMNCHLKTKFDQNRTKIEIEKLYYTITNLKSNNQIIVDDQDRLECELKRFGLRQRQDFTKDLISKDQYNQIKEFNANKTIIVRKADKSNTFVIMNREDYNNKINELLCDNTKFKIISKDTSDSLKSEINKLITTMNAVSEVNFPKLSGHFEPGYVYGNPKTHKDIRNPPLRPIVSQVSTVTYDTAKWLNSIITPFMPKTHMVESTFEFIQIAKTIENPKLLASLDVESLFTNVPVLETVNIILENVYNHPDLPPPRQISKVIMKKLLIICTTKTPFRSPDGQLYQQINGVSMGTPLGPTFANYYMCNLENTVFANNPSLKPPTYCRYVDDIFMVLDNFHQLTTIKTAFETCSVLNFTFEIESMKQIPFLDTLITRNNQIVTTSIFTKATNTGECLNFNSICPDRYKIGVITNFLHRAYEISSSWTLFTAELQRIQQLLINNNFPNSLVEKQISKFLERKCTPPRMTESRATEPRTDRQVNDNTTPVAHSQNEISLEREENQGPDDPCGRRISSSVDNEGGIVAEGGEIGIDVAEERTERETDTNRIHRDIKIFFRNQMTSTYKLTEKALHKIISENIRPADPTVKLKLMIFYQNRKLKNVFIKNNSNPPTEEFNVVYRYTCDRVHSNSAQACYIGHTTTTIKERMKQHASIKKHYKEEHNCNITGSQMLPHASVIVKLHNKQDLVIMEALIIKQESPIINTQCSDFNKTLKIFQ